MRILLANKKLMDFFLKEIIRVKYLTLYQACCKYSENITQNETKTKTILKDK